MPKIMNENYKRFLKTNEIETIDEDYINKIIGNINGKFSEYGKALVIVLYYTGARPNEVLDLKTKDFGLDKSFVTISLKGSKGGKSRRVYLQYKRPLVKFLYSFSKSMFPEMFIFWPFRSNYRKVNFTKKGEPRESIVNSGKLQYYFNKWFDKEFTAYFLRHNRFTLMAQRGATDTDIRNAKGGGSIKYYIHQSVDRAKKNAKIMY